MKNLLRVALIGAASSILLAGSNEGLGTYWKDKNGTIHQNNRVSLSAVRSFGIDRGLGDKKYHDTRVKIVQAWGCLALERSTFSPTDVKKIDDRSAVISFPPTLGRGVSFGYRKDNNDSFQVLGKKDCEEIGNVEGWTVEQKIGGSWSVVAKGRFFFDE